MGVDATHGLQRGRLGGHDAGMGDSGHCDKNLASFKAGSTAYVIWSGCGFRTAIPFEKMFCHVPWRCDIVSLFKIIRPSAPFPTMSSAIFGYLS